MDTAKPLIRLGECPDWPFAGRVCHFVGFVMLWLISERSLTIHHMHVFILFIDISGNCCSIAWCCMMLVVICDIKFAFTITNIIVFNVASSCSRNTNIFVVHVFKSFPHFALFGILWLYRVLGVCIDYVSSVRVHCYFFFLCTTMSDTMSRQCYYISQSD